MNNREGLVVYPWERNETPKMTTETTIHIPETDQIVAVVVAATGDGRLSVTLDGVSQDHDIQALHRTALTHPEPHVRRAWAQIVALGQSALRESARAAADADELDREQRVQACGGHHAIGSTDRAFAGPVAADQNPAAHGGITRVETCRCGAERLANLNGRHSEEGHWH